MPGSNIVKEIIAVQFDILNLNSFISSMASLQRNLAKSMNGIRSMAIDVGNEVGNNIIQRQRELAQWSKSVWGSREKTRLDAFISSMKQFKMELLGVMFFGMMLKNTMFGLLKPAGEATGIFELWTETLTVFFLPIMIAILPLLISMMEWFMNAPDWLKMVIGGVVLFIGSLGALLFTYGGVHLGVRSLLADLGALFKLFSSFSVSQKFLDIFATGGWLDTMSKNPIFKGVTFLVGLYVTYEWMKTIKDMVSDLHTTFLTRLTSVFQGVFAGAFLGLSIGGLAGAGAGIVVGIGVTAILNLLDVQWEAGEYHSLGSKLKRWYGDFKFKADAIEAFESPKFISSMSSSAAAFGGSPNIQYSPTYNVNSGEIKSVLEEHDRSIWDKIKSLVGVGG